MNTEIGNLDEFINPDFFENDEGHVDYMFSFNDEPAVPSPVSTASEQSQQLDEPSMAKWASENQTALNGFLNDDAKFDFASAFEIASDVVAPGANETLFAGGFDYAAMLDSQASVDPNDILKSTSNVALALMNEQYSTLAYANNMVGLWASQTNALPVANLEQVDASPAMSPAPVGTATPLFDTPASMSASPADLVLKTPASVKRKLSPGSEEDSESAPAPAKRGRKTFANSAAKPPRPTSKTGGSPLARTVTMAAELGATSACSSPQSGSPIAPLDPAKARPRSNVPDKFLKSGQAQKILGMSAEQIKRYAQYSDILDDLVGTDRYEEAVKFGEQLEGIRLQGRGAAQKSREEKRRQKEELIRLQAQLDMERAATKAHNERVAAQLAKLVGSGLLTREQAAAIIA